MNPLVWGSRPGEYACKDGRHESMDLDLGSKILEGAVQI
jgi:hypothetical protein